MPAYLDVPLGFFTFTIADYCHHIRSSKYLVSKRGELAFPALTRCILLERRGPEDWACNLGFNPMNGWVVLHIRVCPLRNLLMQRGSRRKENARWDAVITPCLSLTSDWLTIQLFSLKKGLYFGVTLQEVLNGRFKLSCWEWQID